MTDKRRYLICLPNGSLSMVTSHPIELFHEAMIQRDWGAGQLFSPQLDEKL
ncbi:MAG: hypothetical protein KZQ61_14245 [Candidatus Thiodiazotropha sp. (ex Lucinoma aequizonata)]|nr:hypothetical protein [Candidatus Thiodiazotropha sp. (ex Lucinoma aequizonata)]